jgi:hypothetical protein
MGRDRTGAPGRLRGAGGCGRRGGTGADGGLDQRGSRRQRQGAEEGQGHRKGLAVKPHEGLNLKPPRCCRRWRLGAQKTKPTRGMSLQTSLPFGGGDSWGSVRCPRTRRGAGADLSRPRHPPKSPANGRAGRGMSAAIQAWGGVIRGAAMRLRSRRVQPKAAAAPNSGSGPGTSAAAGPDPPPCTKLMLVKSM